MRKLLNFDLKQRVYSKLNFFIKRKNKFIVYSLVYLGIYKLFRLKIKDLWYDNDFKEIFSEIFYPYRRRFNKEYYEIHNKREDLIIKQNKEKQNNDNKDRLENILASEILKLHKYDESRDSTKNRRLIKKNLDEIIKKE